MHQSLFALLVALTGTLSARPFTDVGGKVIEAEFVSIVGDQVTISRDGRSYTLSFNRFSVADQDYIKLQSLKSSATSLQPKAEGKIVLAGKELVLNGALNLIEAPLNEQTLKKTRRNKEVTGIKIGLVLPSTFDPAVPQKVLWVSAAVNGDGERKAGNLDAISPYAETAVPEGWAIITVDCNLGNPLDGNDGHADIDQAIQHQAVAMLSAEWPAFRKSIFVCAGFSGGAKSSFYRVGQLATADLSVSGLFLGGCNENKTEAAKTETKVSGSTLRKIKVFVSNGTSDEIAPPVAGERVGNSADKDFGEVKIETYDGGHVISSDHLKAALTWFSTTEKVVD